MRAGRQRERAAGWRPERGGGGGDGAAEAVAAARACGGAWLGGARQLGNSGRLERTSDCPGCCWRWRPSCCTSSCRCCRSCTAVATRAHLGAGTDSQTDANAMQTDANVKHRRGFAGSTRRQTGISGAATHRVALRVDTGADLVWHILLRGGACGQRRGANMLAREKSREGRTEAPEGTPQFPSPLGGPD